MRPCGHIRDGTRYAGYASNDLGNTDLRSGHLRFRGALITSPSIASCNQHLTPNHHSVFYHGECGLLHPLALGCSLDDGQRGSGKLLIDIVSVTSPRTDRKTQTAITRLLGPGFGIVAAIFICLVVAGSLLGNSFVAGRMAVAAANQNWLPRMLSVVGRVGIGRGAERSQENSRKVSGSDAPINAIVLSTVLSAIYILLGNFRALLTFNGLGEYTFFFLTVLGALILRYREPHLERPYKTFALIPVIFALVSGFVVVRGAAFAPAQASILVGLWVLGLVFYWVSRRYWEG